MQRQEPLHLFALALAGAITFGATHAASADDKRQVPDYDGRGNPDADAGSWALWIPRSVLVPVYFAHEYAVRRPLGALITHAERDRWASSIEDFFRFGPDDRYLWFPTVFYDFGLRPSVGLHITGTGVFADGNDVSLHAATGGRDWIVASLRDHYQWNTRTSVATHIDLSRRPDLSFMGLGPDVREADRARYGLQRIDVGSQFTHSTGEAQIVLAAGARDVGFRAGNQGGDPMLSDQIRDNMIEAPPGFDRPYTALYQQLALTLDTRPARPAPGTGARLAMYAESAFDLRSARRWARYGASLGGTLDLNGHQRTLGLRVSADFADPFGPGAVPFTELVSLGGDDAMRGFVSGWMLGRSAVMAEAAYAWPVWFCLDGTARLSVGNAFGAELDGFAPRKLRLSGDIGVTTIGSRDHRFEILVGLGTETFEQGGHIKSVRFSFGSRGGI